MIPFMWVEDKEERISSLDEDKSGAEGCQRKLRTGRRRLSAAFWLFDQALTSLGPGGIQHTKLCVEAGRVRLVFGPSADCLSTSPPPPPWNAIRRIAPLSATDEQDAA